MRSKTAQIIFVFLTSFFFVTTAFAVAPPNSSETPSQPTGQPGCLSTDPNCYVLLAPLPLGDPNSNTLNVDNPNQTTNPSAYIKGIIDLFVALVGAATVLRLIFAGFQYITTENFSKKGSARENITSALLALLLVIAAFTILNAISPQFTNIGLNIDPISPKIQGPIRDDGTCAGPIINGTCTQPTTSTGGAIAVGCITNCVSVSEFNFSRTAKPAGGNCTVDGTCRGYGCQGSSCFINQTLGKELDTLNDALQHDGVVWQVSEMFPSTVTHKDDCHKPNNEQSGTCVDVNFPGASTKPDLMKKILTDVSRVFNSFVYEVCPASKAQQLQSQFPQYASHFNCYNTTTGENMHINMK